ncbi:glycosyltransferase family 2 protein [Larsenimonas salina]|uniref:glycosyltransferase family 2 protein n=1 Tax=Larsenimonas salina TaxID=1295565 RepID=UPI002073F037|nr:glycosyltransferase family 2 protein [Larsenimonas salina]MCM5705008.1 glycosyltransferase family 2 protein [Larsenimonas salina]
MTDARACIVVPVFNHEGAIVGTCERLKALSLPILLVDDGSHPACADVLDKLSLRHTHIHLIRLAQNSGKGAAVRAGLFAAFERGYTHALQVDADGQHEVDDLPGLLESMRETPRTLMVGIPEFDDSVPMHRFICRYITHVWVWFNTLSLKIVDSMCGVRLYPLAQVAPMLKRYPCGDRMDFDTEVLVRWHWLGGDIQNHRIRVRYPQDGVSHFRLWRDNVILARMHCRLTLGMLVRAPSLLFRKRTP